MNRLALVTLFLLASTAAAQGNEEMEANRSFDAIMQSNTFRPQSRISRSMSSRDSGGDSRASTTVPLRDYETLREALQAARDANEADADSPVVLGASQYSGRVRDGVLELRLQMHVTLGKGRPGAAPRWKSVPLVGETVVVVRATEGGRPLPLVRENGYHVWLTQRSGEVDVQVDLRVPAQGPDGSIEYGFRVARTPVTQVEVTFPVPDLQPRISAAVSSRVASTANTSVLRAALRPTARIDLVGYRRLEVRDERAAKVYVENLTLGSLGDSSVELFTVLRYKILYAGVKTFDVRLPDGYAVVSAEGEGAFRYTTQSVDGANVLRGETAFPIRDNYEISLRLKRELERDEERFELNWPHATGTEREQGWLALEVPGKRQLKVEAVAAAQAVDVRQLPSSIIDSAVSPVLGAFRFIGDDARVNVRASRLPEQEPAGASVDQLEAWTVMAEQGPTMTELKLTLRNRLRHRLRVLLPDNADVRSVLLDGEPVKPSRDEDGALVLPLKRSMGGARLSPFTLQLVYAEENNGFGFFGARRLALPGLELPVSSAHWRVYLPQRNQYSALQGDVEEQQFYGQARWHAQPSSGVTNGLVLDRNDSSAVAGAAPIRIQVPKTGRVMNYRRYWLEAEHGVEISFWYARRWLESALLLMMWVLFAAAAFRLADAFIPGTALAIPPRWSAAAVAGVAAIVYVWLGHLGELFLAVPLVVLAIGITRFSAVARWVSTLPERWRARSKPQELAEPTPWWRRAFGWAWTLAVGGVMVILLFSLLGLLAELMWIITRPFS